MMWLPSCPWPCFMSETNVLIIGFSEIGENVDSLALGFFSEILIANGAFWINLSHQLRAEISQIFSNIFHSSPAIYFILVWSYWKKWGSAPKKGGVRTPWTPPPPLDPPLRRQSICSHVITVSYLIIYVGFQLLRHYAHCIWICVLNDTHTDTYIYTFTPILCKYSVIPCVTPYSLLITPNKRKLTNQGHKHK